MRAERASPTIACAARSRPDRGPTRRRSRAGEGAMMRSQGIGVGVTLVGVSLAWCCQAQDHQRSDDRLALHASVASEVVATLGSTAVPQCDDPRETVVRIWVEFDGSDPDRLLVLRRRGEVCSGAVYLHWRTGTPEAAVVEDDVSRGFRIQSSQLGRGVAVAELRSEQDWSLLWKELISEHVLELPCACALPNERTWFDHPPLLYVDVLGERTRSYRYVNPRVQEWAEARNADAILTRVLLLFSKSRR